jgi:DNA polymerase (family X)
MAANAELARIFHELAMFHELMGANAFRCSAYEKIARTLGSLPVDVAALAPDLKKLTALEGIGESSARKIVEFAQTGKVTEHEDLSAKIPSGLLEVMRVPGLGAKTVKLLWEKGGVTDMASLKAGLESGALLKIPRMGEKTLEKLKSSLVFMESAGDRVRLGQALPMAEALVAQVRKLPGVTQAEFAGSLRRGRDTIADIDILASAKKPAELAEAFRALPQVATVLAAGESKVSVRLASGVQADLRIVPEESFGAAMLYFTGSKEQNVALRERAIRRQLRLNEYGMFPSDGEEKPQARGVKPVAGKTEESVYEALGLPWIPPELREGIGIIEQAPPDLITIDDIKAELHAHTIASDGKLTIEALAAEAKRRGFHTIAVTDHSKSSPQAGGLSPERLLQHIEAVHEARERIKGIHVLAGSEVDILPDGRLDYDDSLLAKLDIVIASPHAGLRQEPALATKRMLAAVRHPLVHIIGHPTGRRLSEREGISPDMEKVVAAAVEHDTVLEINANSTRLDLRDVHVKMVMDAGGLVAIDTDAHTAKDFDQLRYGILTARRGWVTAKRCVNTWDAKRLRDWLRQKRS